MSTALHDNPTVDNHEHYAALLCPGTLVYLWAPGAHRSVDRLLVRVESATQDTIIGNDLRGGEHSRGQYRVGAGVMAAARWTWEVAAPAPAATGVVQVLDWGQMNPEERRAFLLGSGGGSVTARLVSGDGLHGVPTAVAVEAGEPLYVQLVGKPDTRGSITHIVRCDHISAITR